MLLGAVFAKRVVSEYFYIIYSNIIPKLKHPFHCIFANSYFGTKINYHHQCRADGCCLYYLYCTVSWWLRLLCHWNTIIFERKKMKILCGFLEINKYFSLLKTSLRIWKRKMITNVYKSKDGRCIGVAYLKRFQKFGLYHYFLRSYYLIRKVTQNKRVFNWTEYFENINVATSLERFKL